MRSRTCVIAGIACLVAAQLLASLPLSRARQDLVPNHEIYEALTPGEFAGTLMLGGFRGLACDLLWIRADNAKEQGHYYESLALFQAISRIQPRFEQIWTFMSWDMAYNIGHEVEDEDTKWTWMLAGLQTNVRGCMRNPGSERVLRHLAWMFNHRGDLFSQRIQATAWAPLLAPVIDSVNRELPEVKRVPPFPTGPGADGAGLSNFRISAIIYRAAVALAEARGADQSQFVRRMVPLAIESDGNLSRNGGHHLAALRIWLEALDAWQEVRAYYDTLKGGDEDTTRREFGIDSYERNEGHLRRKVAELGRQLAPDAAAGDRFAEAVLARRFTESRGLLELPGWLASARHGHIRWLDER